MSLSTIGLESWILGLAQAVELATTDDYVSESQNGDGEVDEDEEDSISDEIRNIQYNDEDDCDKEDYEEIDSCIEMEERALSHSMTDVKQRVILALEEFSNTILRKVNELEEKERHAARLKLDSRTIGTSSKRKNSSTLFSPDTDSEEELPER